MAVILLGQTLTRAGRAEACLMTRLLPATSACSKSRHLLQTLLFEPIPFLDEKSHDVPSSPSSNGEAFLVLRRPRKQLTAEVSVLPSFLLVSQRSVARQGSLGPFSGLVALVPEPVM
ncbi:hypothetical protein CONLIGDRAFT_513951 [Coniochaeta ligniaria NRRL 30616]|uniref:Uncharacterized protein n=1 Tax=Coniochaeta ligniaria NRRL 30616 TaxID=1408157 RepID=A0A1J7IE51_9PEZI|nr:hypothetical protein CONLIGDRAFT_513951 [Coniochaeta ligniaria NRRL 30616]